MLTFLFVPDLCAVVITFEFTGTVDEVVDPCDFFDPSVVAGTEFTGSYTFNSDVTDTNLDPRYGSFIYSQLAPIGFSMSVSVGNETFESIGTSSISTINLPGYNFYQVYTDIDPPIFFHHAYIALILKGGVDMLGSDSLPLIPPDIQKATYFHTITIDYANAFSDSYIDGTLSSLTVVPEPTTFGLFAIVGMLVRRRRRICNLFSDYFY